MGKNVGKVISKNLSGKYSQKLIDHVKQSATGAPKIFSKRIIRKTAKANGDVIGNKTADRIIKVSRSSLENNSEIITNNMKKK